MSRGSRSSELLKFDSLEVDHSPHSSDEQQPVLSNKRKVAAPKLRSECCLAVLSVVGFSAAAMVVTSIVMAIISLGGEQQLRFTFDNTYGYIGIVFSIGCVLFETATACCCCTAVSICGAAKGKSAKVRTWLSIVASVIGLLVVILHITFLTLIGVPGSTAHLARPRIVPMSPESPLYHLASTLQDPSAPGSYKVLTLTYGSGTDKHRSQYSVNARIKTPTVNATAFMPDFKGDVERERRDFFGFGADAFPLNAVVYYPDARGPFPLVLIGHGDHFYKDFSELGYDYLGNVLASRGYVVASVDNNFLNSDLFGASGVDDINVRGWMHLKHMELFKQWNDTMDNPFYGKVDLNNIALIGHSRGGGGVGIAALYNRLNSTVENGREIPLGPFNFGIQSVVYLAPYTGYLGDDANKLRYMENINSLLLLGGHDANMVFASGINELNRVNWSKDDGATDYVSAMAYLYQANHVQFHSTWGSLVVTQLSVKSDQMQPTTCLMNNYAVMPFSQQQKVTTQYVSAFLESTIKGRKEYNAVLRDYRIVQGWASAADDKPIIASSFMNSRFKLVHAFEPNATYPSAVATTGFVDAAAAPMLLRVLNTPQLNTALKLKMTKDAAASVTFNIDTTKLPIVAMELMKSNSSSSSSSTLSLDVAIDKGGLTDIQVTIIGASALSSTVTSVTDYQAITPPLPVFVTKLTAVELSMFTTTYEVLLQTYEIPINALLRDVDLTAFGRVVQIQVTFTANNDGAELFLDNVGFRM